MKKLILSLIVFSYSTTGLCDSLDENVRVSVTGEEFRKVLGPSRFGDSYEDPSGIIWSSLIRHDDSKTWTDSYGFTHSYNKGDLDYASSVGEAQSICDAAGGRLPEDTDFIRLSAFLGLGFPEGYSAKTKDGSEFVLPFMNDLAIVYSRGYTRSYGNYFSSSSGELSFGSDSERRVVCISGVVNSSWSAKFMNPYMSTERTKIVGPLIVRNKKAGVPMTEKEYKSPRLAGYNDSSVAYDACTKFGAHFPSFEKILNYMKQFGMKDLSKDEVNRRVKVAKKSKQWKEYLMEFVPNEDSRRDKAVVASVMRDYLEETAAMTFVLIDDNYIGLDLSEYNYTKEVDESVSWLGERNYYFNLKTGKFHMRDPYYGRNSLYAVFCIRD